jgi:hypothetical protein
VAVALDRFKAQAGAYGIARRALGRNRRLRRRPEQRGFPVAAAALPATDPVYDGRHHTGLGPPVKAAS